jgi:hypothetical protein
VRALIVGSLLGRVCGVSSEHPPSPPEPLALRAVREIENRARLHHMLYQFHPARPAPDSIGYQVYIAPRAQGAGHPLKPPQNTRGARYLGFVEVSIPYVG